MLLELVHRLDMGLLAGRPGVLMVTPKGKKILFGDESFLVEDFVPEPVPARLKGKFPKDWEQMLGAHPGVLVSKRPDREQYMRLWDEQWKNFYLSLTGRLGKTTPPAVTTKDEVLELLDFRYDADKMWVWDSQFDGYFEIGTPMYGKASDADHQFFLGATYPDPTKFPGVSYEKSSGMYVHEDGSEYDVNDFRATLDPVGDPLDRTDIDEVRKALAQFRAERPPPPTPVVAQTGTLTIDPRTINANPAQKYHKGDTVLYFGEKVTILEAKWDHGGWTYRSHSEVEDIVVNEKYWAPESSLVSTEPEEIEDDEIVVVEERENTNIWDSSPGATQKYHKGDTVLLFGEPVTILEAKWDTEWLYRGRGVVETTTLDESTWITEGSFLPDSTDSKSPTLAEIMDQNFDWGKMASELGGAFAARAGARALAKPITGFSPTEISSMVQEARARAAVRGVFDAGRIRQDIIERLEAIQGEVDVPIAPQSIGDEIVLDFVDEVVAEVFAEENAIAGDLVAAQVDAAAATMTDIAGLSGTVPEILGSPMTGAALSYYSMAAQMSFADDRRTGGNDATMTEPADGSGKAIGKIIPPVKEPSDRENKVMTGWFARGRHMLDTGTTVALYSAEQQKQLQDVRTLVSEGNIGVGTEIRGPDGEIGTVKSVKMRVDGEFLYLVDISNYRGWRGYFRGETEQWVSGSQLKAVMEDDGAKLFLAKAMESAQVISDALVAALGGVVYTYAPDVSLALQKLGGGGNTIWGLFGGVNPATGASMGWGDRLPAGVWSTGHNVAAAFGTKYRVWFNNGGSPILKWAGAAVAGAMAINVLMMSWDYGINWYYGGKDFTTSVGSGAKSAYVAVKDEITYFGKGLQTAAQEARSTLMYVMAAMAAYTLFKYV